MGLIGVLNDYFCHQILKHLFFKCKGTNFFSTHKRSREPFYYT